MKRLTFAACLMVQSVFIAPTASAADFKLSTVLNWTDQIGDALRGFDADPAPVQRGERDWDGPKPTEPQQWRWRSGDTWLRPWLRMQSEGAGIGLLLEF
jgi:hypothetical protein